NVFGVGVFAGSECWGLRLERNRFLHEPPHVQTQQGRVQVAHVLVGYLLAPSLVYRSSETALASRRPSASLLRSLLVRAHIRDNEFTGLSVAIVAFAEFGDVRISDNEIRDCAAGIWLFSLRAQAFAELAGKYTVASNLVEGTLTGLRAVMLE